MNTQTSELLQLKRQYDEENELLQELEKTPMSEGQLNDLLGRGRTELEFAQLSKRLEPMLNDLRERKLIVPDAPLSFESFKKANPKMVSIHASSLQCMEHNEYELFSRAFKRSNEQVVGNFDSREYVGFKVYQDMPMDVYGQGGKSVQPYSYSENGRTYHSGEGFITSQTNVLVNFDEPGANISADDKKKFNNAKAIYDNARKEIDSILRALNLQVVNPLGQTTSPVF